MARGCLLLLVYQLGMKTITEVITEEIGSRCFTNTVSEKERKRRICFQNNDYSSSFQCDKGRSCHGMTKNFCLRPSETPGKAKLQQVRKERHICLTCWGQHGINWDSWAWGLGMWWEPKATFPGPQCLPKAIPLRNKGLWKKISG